MLRQLGIIPDRYIQFGTHLTKLTSFKVALTYVTLVGLSPLVRRISQPYGCKKLLVIHNLICVALSFGSMVTLFYGVYESGALFEMRTNMIVKSGLMLYVISKYIELGDTMFMVLRHKQRQITFLHVYHHGTILVLGDYAYQFAAWPPVGAMIGLNSLVHVFLYSYYAKAAIAGQVDAKWKKRLTQLQILQFLIGLIECTYGYLYHGFCVHSILYGLSMLFLFSNFYYWAYRVPAARLRNE